MTPDRGSRFLVIVGIGPGGVVVNVPGEIKVAPQAPWALKETRRKLPDDVNLQTLSALVVRAFPEANLEGIDEYAYRADHDSGGGEDAIRTECKKLAKAGFSPRDVAGIIISQNSRLSAAFHLGGIDTYAIDDYINRLASQISPFYPQDRKKR